MRVLCNDMIIDPQDCRPFTSAPSLLWRWETSSWPRSFSRRNWRWRYPRSCAVWPGTACERLPPANQGLWAEDGCGLLSAGRHAALSRDVAGGGTGDHLRDRHAGQVRAERQRPPGEPRPASAAEEGLLRAAAHLHHIHRLQEDRAGNGYQGGSER